MSGIERVVAERMMKMQARLQFLDLEVEVFLFYLWCATVSARSHCRDLPLLTLSCPMNDEDAS